MSSEVHEFPAPAGKMLDDLGPLLGGHVVCVVVLAGREIHLMYPATMERGTIEAIEDALIAAMLQGDGQ